VADNSKGYHTEQNGLLEDLLKFQAKAQIRFYPRILAPVYIPETPG